MKIRHPPKVEERTSWILVGKKKKTEEKMHFRMRILPPSDKSV